LTITSVASAVRESRDHHAEQNDADNRFAGSIKSACVLAVVSSAAATTFQTSGNVIPAASSLRIFRRGAMRM
jgi:hypothetical protein